MRLPTTGLSNLADGVLKVALPLVAIQFTRSPTLVAGLTVTITLPWLLFALPAGVFAAHGRGFPGFVGRRT